MKTVVLKGIVAIATIVDNSGISYSANVFPPMALIGEILIVLLYPMTKAGQDLSTKYLRSGKIPEKNKLAC